MLSSAYSSIDQAMIQQLHKASKSLQTALDHYLKTYQDIYDIYVAGKPVNTIPYDLGESLAEQLPVIKSFGKKLKLAQSISGRCSNASPLIVPIHILPLEILARIFQLLMGDNCTYRPAKCALYPARLQTLMSTCDRWRQVIINSPFLWTHIDLKVESGYRDTTLSRVSYASLCVQRAAQMPLEVHIIDLSNREPPRHAIRTLLVPFIASIAPRVKSFVSQIDDLIPYVSALAAFFDNCTPGTLETLQMFERSRPGRDLVVLDAETEVYNRVLSARLSEDRFEEIFRGVTALRLDFIHPTHRWTSNAYHGLVELRFTSLRGPRITEAQLAEILKQSPGLRILECVKSFDNPLTSKLVNLIPLPSLEIVNLGHNDFQEVEDIVRWLAPGTKPLQLLLTSLTSFGPCLAAFVSRSNVTRFYCQQRGLMGVTYFVHHLPHLQTLALGRGRLGARARGLEGKTTVKGKISSPLQTLYVIDLNCSNLKPLYRAFSLESLRRVVFYRCSPEECLEEVIAKIPAATRSKIEFVIVPKDDPNPVSEWELFSRRLYD